jgi:glycosyltransferase involved in cell wall biosynthesis
MKILVIHQFYLRPGEAGGTRFNDFCAQWQSAGHDVEVVASSVPYTTGVRSGGAFPWVSGSEAGVDVTRVWTVNHPAGRVGRRMASMLTFGGLAVAAAVRSAQPDVVIASSPALVTALPGALAAAHAGARFVFEVRDLWPESAVTTGVVGAESMLVRAAEGLEAWAYESADAVVALTPGIGDDIVERGLCPRSKLEVIPNGVVLDRIPRVDRGDLRRTLGWDDRFVAIYAGAHGIANDLDQLIDVARRMPADAGVQLVAVGDGPMREALVRRSRRLGLTNLQWRPAVSPGELRRWLQAADVGLVILQDNPTFQTVYPNKAFDYMAAGIPVVATVDGVLGELLTTSGAGISVPPGRPDHLVEALLGLRRDEDAARDMGNAGRRLVRSRFDRRSHARRYLELLEHLT